jgi:hypothetical protein
MTAPPAPIPTEAALEGIDVKRALIAQVRAGAEAFAQLAPARAVHAGRVRLKRTRAIARLCVLAAPWTARRLNGLARTLMHSLSAVRDLDALNAAALDLADAHAGKARKGLLALAQDLAQARAKVAPIDIAKAAAGARDLLGLSRALPAVDAADLQAGLARIVKRARKAFKRARSAGRGDAEARHAWRKRVKDRLYAQDLVGRAAWPSGAPWRRALTQRLAETLGEERDARLLLERLEAQPPAGLKQRRWRAAKRALRRTIKRHARNADRLGARLFTERTP